MLPIYILLKFEIFENDVIFAKINPPLGTSTMRLIRFSKALQSMFPVMYQSSQSFCAGPLLSWSDLKHDTDNAMKLKHLLYQRNGPELVHSVGKCLG
jgi:hypothetical protein